MHFQVLKENNNKRKLEMLLQKARTYMLIFIRNKERNKQKNLLKRNSNKDNKGKRNLKNRK